MEKYNDKVKILWKDYFKITYKNYIKPKLTIY